MKWTKEETDILVKHYADKTLDELNELLPNRGLKPIYCKAQKLGLRKSAFIIQKGRLEGIAKARLSLTDELKEKAAENRRITLRKERIRMSYGLPRKTRIKLSQFSKKVTNKNYQIRYRLKKKGYRIEHGSFVAHYDNDTKRNTLLEEIYKTYGFRFVRSGDSYQDEDVKATHDQPFNEFYTQ